MAGNELTQRQREVLRLVGQGKTNDEIGAELGIATSTAKQHVMALRHKTGITSKRRLAAYAASHAAFQAST